jgi:DNA-binding NtrC family response regulator
LQCLEDCEFQIVETRKDFRNALDTFQPDVILSDFSLPQFDGLKALQLTLEHAPLTPLIIWTSSISEDVAVDCMKAGASNYVIKENLKRLAPAVTHALEEREVLVARKQAEEALRASESRLVRALSGAQISVWEWNIQTNQMLWSPEFFEIAGIEENTLWQHLRVTDAFDSQ